MKSLRALPVLGLPLLLALAACDEPVAPTPQDLLEDLDEAAIHGAVSQRVAAINASAGSATVFWSAINAITADDGFDLAATDRVARADRAGSDGPRGRASLLRQALPLPAGIAASLVPPVTVAAELIPLSFHGQTLVYDPVQGDWVVDHARTGAPADGVRIIWYNTTTDGAIASPLVVRGHIDARTLTSTEIDWAAVTVFSDVLDAVVADYQLGFGETETEARWDVEYQVVGEFSSATNQVDVDFVFTGFEDLVTGDDLFTFDLQLDDTGFSYRFVGTDSFDPATGEVTEEFDITATIGGQVTGMAFVAVTTNSAFHAVGSITHRGVKIADIELTSTDIHFLRPDGGEYGAADSEKLATVLFALLAPYNAIDILFG